MVNLLCILGSRIRNYRELLMIFFHDKTWYRPEPLFSVEEEDEDEEEEGSQDKQGTETEDAAGSEARTVTSPVPSQDQTLASSTTKKPEYEFLLFNYLLRFVHREGQIGDFARAGLLFLMDVAMSPIDSSHGSQSEDNLASSTSTISSSSDPATDAALALAEYILDGDFSDVLAAGLAAVYSVLPTKLEVRPPVQTEAAPSSGMILGSNAVELSEDAKEKQEMERETKRAMGVEESSTPDFHSHLDHFLKLLEFLQDILRRNITPDTPDGSLEPSALVGASIVQSILDAVRRVFLENVLYPSVLECSEADGSAVAVMSYIEIMLRTLGHGQLGDLLVDFLTSEDDTEDVTRSRMRPRSRLTMDLSVNAPPPVKPTRATKMRRRKSTAMALLEMEIPETPKVTEYFTSVGRFTLKDLLLSSLRSASQPSTTSALQLLQTMLQQYCRLSIDKLLLVILDPYATSFPHPAALLPPPSASPPSEEDDDEKFVYPGADAEMTLDELTGPAPISSSLFVLPETTYWTHEREMNLYLSLVSRVNPNHNEDAFSTGYDHYLRDALSSIRDQQCFSLDIDPETREKSKHRLNPNDPMLASVLESLRRFFANTPELNMALTGVLATLAVCPDRSLAGWLTFACEDGKQLSVEDLFESQSGRRDDGDDRSIDWRIEHDLSATTPHTLSASRLDERTRPVVYTVFHGLVSQLERYRQLVEHFDQFLLERRQGLLFSENLTDALTLALELDAGATPRTAAPFSGAVSPEPTTPRPKAKSKSSFVSFLTPKKSKSTKTSTGAGDSPAQRGHRALDASPFGPHYQRTGSIVVEPFLAPSLETGPWSPAKPKRWNADEADVFASSGQWGGETSFTAEPEQEVFEQEPPKTTSVSLSRLLDNVVILEESMKELVAIIHARRSLGIDSVRYL